MSTIIMSACWPLQMPPTPKAVLISLADNANDHGHCWPSLTTIAERTCFGRTAVIEAIKWLEEHGALQADRSDRYKTSYVVTPNEYRQPDQSGRRTSSRSDKLVRLPDNEVRETDDEVRQADTNRKEPSRTVNKSNRHNANPAQLDFSTWPAEPSPEVLADWLHVRKKRKADVTATVLKTFGKELHKAASLGFTVDDCLSKCVTRNWTGFEAAWIERDNPGVGARGSPPAPPGKTMQALMKLEEMKNGLADPRNSDRIPEADLPRIGSTASGRGDPRNGAGVG